MLGSVPACMDHLLDQWSDADPALLSIAAHHLKFACNHSQAKDGSRAGSGTVKLCITRARKH